MLMLDAGGHVITWNAGAERMKGYRASEIIGKHLKIANNIVRASDGIEALEMLRGTNGKTQTPTPLILLIDLNMPRMNGIELVQALRRDESLRRSIVYILTISERDEDKTAAYDLNVAGYVTKAKAADDFMNLVTLLDYYVCLVELP
jgi:CheY-like chemotaxis protein